MAGKTGKVVREVAGALVADATLAPLATWGWGRLWNKITGIAAGHAEKKVQALTQVAKRRALAEGLLGVAKWGDRKNIIFLLKVARSRRHETEMVRDLGELMCAGDNEMKDVKDRVALLKKLNSRYPSGPITEAEEGDVMSELLNDNGLEQKFEEARDKGTALYQEIVRAYLPEAKRQLENTGDALATHVGSARSWLRRH